MELKTLSRQDPEFLSYLQGRFSKDHRAIPIQSLNVNSDSESVTFQIIPTAKIQMPPALAKWAEVFKLRYFLLLAFPAFVILTKDLFDDVELDPLLILLSLFGSFFLLVSANLWNDYSDHMKGVDRIRPEFQQKPIQKGWVTAIATKQWALAYLIVGVILGAPALLVEPLIALLVAIPGAVALLAWMNPVKGQRFRRGAEFWVFLLVGPLFTVGFQLAVSGQFDLETLVIGALTGWLGVFLIHLRNFEGLMVNTQAGFQSTVVSLGFEKAKRLLAFWWITLWAGFCVYQFIYAPFPFWTLASVLVGVVSTWPFLKRLRRLPSPVGSEMNALIQAGRRMVSLFWTWWLIQCFWIFLVIELSHIGNGE